MPVCAPEVDEKVAVVNGEYRVQSPGPHTPPPEQQPPRLIVSYLVQLFSDGTGDLPPKLEGQANQFWSQYTVVVVEVVEGAVHLPSLAHMNP